MLIQIAFYSFALLIFLSVLGMLLSSNVLYTAFLLLLSFLALSGIYILIGADFLAITQLVVYIGGVLVLLLFGIMLTNKTHPTKDPSQQVTLAPSTEYRNIFLGIALGGFTFFSLASLILAKPLEEINWIKSRITNSEWVESGTSSEMGILLMTDYLLAFELVAVLLLVALIGSVRLAAKAQE